MPACARHNIGPQAMLAVVAEYLDTGADRPDSWEGTMAQRLIDLEDGISERMSKARAGLAILEAEDQFKVLSEDHLAHALWAMQGLVEEANALQGTLWEKGLFRISRGDHKI